MILSTYGMGDDKFYDNIRRVILIRDNSGVSSDSDCMDKLEPDEGQIDEVHPLLIKS